MGEGSALVLGAAPELRVGLDTELKYIVDADVWYLTGHSEPETVAVLQNGSDAPPFTLFVRPRDPARERWTGPRAGVEAAIDEYGATAAYPTPELASRLPDLLSDMDRIYARIDAGRVDVERAVVSAVATGRRSRPRTGRGPYQLIDPGPLLGELRLLKDDSELNAIRQAARITAESFIEAARCVRVGSGEWEVEAAMDSAFRRRGAAGPAFPTIAASGPNATVLHHVANDRVIRPGDLVLVDAGARDAMYCADMTRTFPTTHHFDGPGRAIYDIVLEAHRAAIGAARPGATLDAVHDAAVRVMARGLRDLKLIEDEAGDAAVSGESPMTRFCPHRTSHWLGLDVHDAGPYVTANGEPRLLEPGMVFTVEPGLYVPVDEEAVGAEWRGIGVRIEDDVLITADGCDVLTAAVPVAADDVAAMRQ